jgi:hypothetical protein
MHGHAVAVQHEQQQVQAAQLSQHMCQKLFYTVLSASSLLLSCACAHPVPNSEASSTSLTHLCNTGWVGEGGGGAGDEQALQGPVLPALLTHVLGSTRVG